MNARRPLVICSADDDSALADKIAGRRMNPSSSSRPIQDRARPNQNPAGWMSPCPYCSPCERRSLPRQIARGRMSTRSVCRSRNCRAWARQVSRSRVSSISLRTACNRRSLTSQRSRRGVRPSSCCATCYRRTRADQRTSRGMRCPELGDASNRFRRRRPCESPRTRCACCGDLLIRRVDTVCPVVLPGRHRPRRGHGLRRTKRHKRAQHRPSVGRQRRQGNAGCGSCAAKRDLTQRRGGRATAIAQPGVDKNSRCACIQVDNSPGVRGNAPEEMGAGVNKTASRRNRSASTTEIPA